MNHEWHKRQKTWDEKIHTRLEKAINVLDHDSTLEHMSVPHMQEILVMVRRLRELKADYNK